MIERKTDDAIIRCYPEKSLIILEYTKLIIGTELINNKQLLLEFIEQHNIKNVIMECSNVYEPDYRAKEWVLNVFFPKLEQLKIKNLVIVNPPLPVRFVLEGFLKPFLLKISFNIHFFSSLDSALSWFDEKENSIA